MSDRGFGSMDERDFDALLESGLNELPPGDDVVGQITPWRRATNLALAGLALTTFTLNFLALNYILPAIGVVLMLLGFRSLRQENGWLRACWMISVFRTAVFWSQLILSTMLWGSAFFQSSLAAALAILNAAVVLVQFICLWGGLLKVQERAGLPRHARGAGALIVWYLIVMLLGIVGYAGVLVFGLLIAYVFIIRSLYKLSSALDEAGYAIAPPSVKISDRALVIALAVALAVGMCSGYLFFDHYKMDWSPVDSAEDAALEGVREQLAALGVPGYVLEDLSAEDLAACDGAVRVVVETQPHSINPERDAKELLITGVAVELSGGEQRWKLIHHFLWTGRSKFYGTEAIFIWPAYLNNDGWTEDGPFTGRVLYDRNGLSYAAPYHSLEVLTYQQNSMFGVQTSTEAFASFSFPWSGKSCRGYLAYDTRSVEDGWLLNSWINYIHQSSPLLLPVQSAMDYKISVGWPSSGSGFSMIQDAIQQWPY